MTTVFLLDDHEIVRRGLRELIEASPGLVVVGESGSALEATRRIPALRPDVAIYDVRLPDGSGIDACRQVRSVDPSIAGLVLTSYDDDEALDAAILAGASGYLLKDIRGNGLVEAILRVADGANLLDSERARRVREGWRTTDEVDPRLRTLSPQERRILEHIAAGMTNRQIGEAMSLAEKTVKNYVTSVLGKMGMERRTQAAVWAATHSAGKRSNRPLRDGSSPAPAHGELTDDRVRPAEQRSASRVGGQAVRARDEGRPHAQRLLHPGQPPDELPHREPGEHRAVPGR